MTKKYVTPSLLNVESQKRLEIAKELINAGVKWIHYDVMDGEFVPNTAISYQEIKNIREKAPKHIMDAHLMVNDPLSYLDEFKNVVDIVTIHFEAIDDLEEFKEFLIENYHEIKIGLAIKPNTSVERIVEFLPYLALVLVMSVEPGKGGQRFIETSLQKINQLKILRLKNSYDYLIQVDGGINNETGPLAFEAGADAAVAGTYLVVEPTTNRIKSILGHKFKMA
ncbi:ribulose-phosphate 3-epimerase [Mycoplasmopsis pullorum]|uniref:ribulose-phosphate 3-epimerase n=1 Tax=Mycoplasmopsis pullorum TaxID=48003 RepID=UPI0011194982|nr:ribulose-phosphate 3-epimerase [Mycoplasmopsis pullorum]TNK83309.1 ribulose-phosphate 3-epimerase [Mycoplasmopsis pullorum]TNK92129.1 ribulose-phosphate 3-epimerase [Mycoplasmopsis pullorum]